MREIKFRGKDGKMEWKYGFLFQGVDEENQPYSVILTQERYEYNPMLPKDATFAFGKDEVFPVFNESVGQFTGFHDKDGTEIYQFDILRLYGKENQYNCLVDWNYELGAWCISIEGTHVGIKPLGEWLCEDKFEVIGNIHDNPELIKKED